MTGATPPTTSSGPQKLRSLGGRLEVTDPNRAVRAAVRLHSLITGARWLARTRDLTLKSADVPSKKRCYRKNAPPERVCEKMLHRYLRFPVDRRRTACLAPCARNTSAAVARTVGVP